MNLKDIPEMTSSRFPRRITVSVSKDTYADLRKLKEQGKDTAEFVRRLIDNALKVALNKAG
ncbi:MAG: hypothetical protein ACXWQO_07990 [Bdellovibrionota bacterium]